MNAFSDIAALHELIMMEQFTNHLEPAIRGWLIDQNPKTLSVLSHLADQYVAVHQADRNTRSSLSPKAKPFHPKTGQGNFQQFKSQIFQNAEQRIAISQLAHQNKLGISNLGFTILTLYVTIARNQDMSWPRVVNVWLRRLLTIMRKPLCNS